MEERIVHVFATVFVQTLPLKGSSVINLFWRNTYCMSTQPPFCNCQGPVWTVHLLNNFWTSNLFPWLNLYHGLSVPIWSGITDPHARQRTSIMKKLQRHALWGPSVTSENKMHFSISVLFSQRDKNKRLCNCQQRMSLRVCTSRHTSHWSVYYCFCPSLKASDWQRAEGTHCSAAFSHIQCVGESGRPRQLAVLAETTERLNHTDGRAFNTTLPSISHKHHPHSYQRRWWKKNN